MLFCAKTIVKRVMQFWTSLSEQEEKKKKETKKFLAKGKGKGIYFYLQRLVSQGKER